MTGYCSRWLNSPPGLLDPSGLLSLSSRFPDQFPFLLESSATGPLGRHSLLLFAGERTQKREIGAQSSYLSQNSLTAHFGLGSAESVAGDAAAAEEAFRRAVAAAMPDRNVESGRGEGDTRGGKPMLAEAGRCRPVEAEADDLEAVAGMDRAALLEEMTRRYEGISATLRRSGAET